MKTAARLVALFLCLVIVFSGYSTIHATLESPGSFASFLKYEVTDVLVADLKQTIRIHNPSHITIPDGELFVPVVRNASARRFAVLYNVSSPVGEPSFLEDSYGNTYAYWNSVKLVPQQSLDFTFSYRVLSLNIQYRVNSSMVGAYNQNSETYTRYTQPEELIQSNDSRIAAKALELTANATTIHEKVSRIYRFAVRHIRYVVQDEERGAVWALENGVGDCSEYSYLFAALSRAVGIPARVQVGFAFHSNTETLDAGHMWAEYYLENYGWVPVDATWQIFDGLDYRHFSSMQSIPQIMSYADFMFNSTISTAVEAEETLQLKPAPPSVFQDIPLIANLTETTGALRQARTALLLGRIFLTPLFFASEAAQVEQTLLSSKAHMQGILDKLEDYSQISSADIAAARQSAEEAARSAWMLVAKTLALTISITVAIVLLATLFIRQRQRRRTRENTASPALDSGHAA